ncbi:hypothetical protein GA0116948_10757 [Chitinophaga costaii]|uniref:Uncharacterized protein n=1 Tax=Chitinophaga costaii TaxID=1335309 RepID=A0A1C4E375_9BACT|nr:hypothetical protein [Chitinophaga costaii]PUZ24351.1 hypothetical protein DCM91_13050 [Chitinophaga costaii]SCC37965.1 hypothetical protein GA0116948_10757 [Chitinophaga costaii]
MDRIRCYFTVNGVSKEVIFQKLPHQPRVLAEVDDVQLEFELVPEEGAHICGQAQSVTSALTDRLEKVIKQYFS